MVSFELILLVYCYCCFYYMIVVFGCHPHVLLSIIFSNDNFKIKSLHNLSFIRQNLLLFTVNDR